MPFWVDAFVQMLQEPDEAVSDVGLKTEVRVCRAHAHACVRVCMRESVNVHLRLLWLCLECSLYPCVIDSVAAVMRHISC